MNTARKILEIKCLSQTLCQNGNVENTNNQLKVLYFIDEYQSVTPQLLISKLGIVKSNLALLTKSLIKDELIVSSKSLADKRAIVYSITEKGKQILDEHLSSISRYIRQDEQTPELMSALEIVLSYLNKKV